ncbi:DUF29 family protein [Roseicella aquatilis]|uniref:DUF29 domain-containing protein n=1 Tax=Roseicella aquatilis TaxID=2527868 RepID=A0A4R4DQ48_9PROT|nr:DUF29 family protein [Roseicella aquatilis]TCZ62918.1 DUF29 domain-containing protein [Roseicella aquatilis]
MPDDLYDTDILAWSRAQAARLRRVADGERVNDVDWDHVIEEVEEVGRSELGAVLSFLELAFIHALKIAAWPTHSAVPHWEGELTNFLVQARRKFDPGMQQHADPAAIYAEALVQVRDLTMQGDVPLPLPEQVVFTAAEFRAADMSARRLLDRIRAAQAPLLGGEAADA